MFKKAYIQIGYTNIIVWLMTVANYCFISSFKFQIGSASYFIVIIVFFNLKLFGTCKDEMRILAKR